MTDRLAIPESGIELDRAAQGLVVRDLAVSYGAVPAVRGVSLSCRPGEILGVVGPNGAGKTSLLSGIAGLVKARGSVNFDGADISHWPAHRRGQAGIVFVAERKRTFPSLSVKENLSVGGWGLDKDETESRVQQVYQLFPRLKEREEVPAFRLSGGEQRMVSIGRALVTGARCILFDELSLGLAPRIVSMLIDTARQLAEEGRMVVLVEQYIGVLLRLADHVHVLERGRSIYDGAPHDTALFLEEHGYLAHQDVEKVEEAGTLAGGDGH